MKAGAFFPGGEPEWKFFPPGSSIFAAPTLFSPPLLFSKQFLWWVLTGNGPVRRKGHAAVFPGVRKTLRHTKNVFPGGALFGAHLPKTPGRPTPSSCVLPAGAPLF